MGVSSYIKENNSFENTKFNLPNGKEVKLGDGDPSEEVLRKAYESAVRSRALDETRFILPASTLTNIGISGNARAFSHLLERLRVSGLKEAEKLYSNLFKELKLVFPKLIDNVENPHGIDNIEFLKSVKNFVPEKIIADKIPLDHAVKLVQSENDDVVLSKVL